MTPCEVDTISLQRGGIGTHLMLDFGSLAMKHDIYLAALKIFVIGTAKKGNRYVDGMINRNCLLENRPYPNRSLQHDTSAVKGVRLIRRPEQESSHGRAG